MLAALTLGLCFGAKVEGLSFELINAPYSEFAKELSAQVGEEVRVVPALQDSKVTILCKESDFSQLRESSKTLLNLEWTKTDTGWLVDRSPEEKKLRASARKFTDSQHKTLLKTGFEVLAGQRESGAGVERQNKALIKPSQFVLANNELIDELIAGRTLAFSGNVSDGLITMPEPVLITVDEHVYQGCIILRYDRPSKQLMVAEGRPFDGEKILLFRHGKQLKNSADSLPEVKKVTDDWAAPDEVGHDPVINRRTNEIRSLSRYDYYSLADHLQFLFKSTGGNYMAEGSRVVVTYGEPPWGETRKRYLDQLIEAANEKIVSSRPLIGWKESGGWISVLHDEWWELENEPTEKQIGFLEDRWKKGNLTIDDYADFVGQLSEEQETYLAQPERMLVDFPIAPLLRWTTFLRLWGRLSEGQKDASRGAGLPASRLNTAQMELYQALLLKCLFGTVTTQEVISGIWNKDPALLDYAGIKIESSQFPLDDPMFKSMARSAENTQLMRYTITLVEGPSTLRIALQLSEKPDP